MFVDQPWDDADIASLYDAFPFTDDLDFYAGLAGTQGGRVLELGCGSGRILVPLARAGHHVVGVDTSPHMLALACGEAGNGGARGGGASAARPGRPASSRAQRALRPRDRGGQDLCRTR